MVVCQLPRKCTSTRVLFTRPVKSYMSIKFGTIPDKIEDNMTDSRLKFVVTPTGKTVCAIVLKFLSGTLKVDRFEGFVNQSNITNFMINKTSVIFDKTLKIHLYRHGFE